MGAAGGVLAVALAASCSGGFAGGGLCWGSGRVLAAMAAPRVKASKALAACCDSCILGTPVPRGSPAGLLTVSAAGRGLLGSLVVVAGCFGCAGRAGAAGALGSGGVRPGVGRGETKRARRGWIAAGSKLKGDSAVLSSADVPVADISPVVVSDHHRPGAVLLWVSPCLKRVYAAIGRLKHQGGHVVPGSVFVIVGA